MTKARHTNTSTAPPKVVPTSVEDQIAAFFKKGGKVQTIPEGVTAEVLRDRRGMSEMIARHTLGGRNSDKRTRKKHEPAEAEDD